MLLSLPSTLKFLPFQTRNIASAYADNPLLQSNLNEKLHASALDIPIPSWFLSLRSTTKPLNNPLLDANILHVLASHARMVLANRAAKAIAAEQIHAAQQDAEDELRTTKEGFASADLARRVFAAESKEQIWRK